MYNHNEGQKLPQKQNTVNVAQQCMAYNQQM